MLAPSGMSRPGFGIARMKAEPFRASEANLIDQDVAELLYGHGVGALVITAVAAIALILIRWPHGSLDLIMWLVVMLFIVLLRTIDLKCAPSRRKMSNWNGRIEIRRFACGVLAGAAGWSVFPLFFFNEFNPMERATLAIIVCAMASGSVTVLAAEQWLVVTFLAALLLPLSVMFAITPGPQHELLSVLGCISFIVLSSTSRVSHNATMTAIRVNRKNQVLMLDRDRAHQSTQDANDELRAAQSSLKETLETLEDRIVARTADLSWLASRDALTGLFNRTALTDRLCAAIGDSQQTKIVMAVLFVDLDGFKEVNDLKGHMCGDHVLREMAKRLLAILPANGVCARWGGDEFVLILTGLAIDEVYEVAHAVAMQVRCRICDLLTFETETVHVDASIGISVFPAHGSTADELLRSADIAMYAAKQGGPGRVQIFDPALAAAIRERHILEDALREALGKGELRLVFQPIVNARTARCEALEALLRWHHPTRGIIGPTEFIPLAERSGEIISIGRWVFEQSCIAAADWPGPCPPAVSLNVSVAQLVGGSVLDDVRTALAMSSLPTDRLHLEVTETVFAEDHQLILPTLVALRALGISISLDDFGTGFSSLSYLRSLPIDTIKIDKSFVDDVQNESGPIIRAIRTLADALDIDVIAEGVETAQDAETLLGMGVNLLQGYLFSKPIPQHLVADWLQDVAVSRFSDEMGSCRQMASS